MSNVRQRLVYCGCHSLTAMQYDCLTCNAESKGTQSNSKRPLNAKRNAFQQCLGGRRPNTLGDEALKESKRTAIPKRASLQEVRHAERGACSAHNAHDF